MEQDVDNSFGTLCSTCLSTDRSLISINGMTQIYQIFRLFMYDFAGDRFGDPLVDMEQLVCWECLALFKRFLRFKRQVHSAQEHLRVLAMSRTQESMDHTYMSQSLSSLDVATKINYDKIYFDYTTRETEWPQQYIAITTSHNMKNERYDVAQVVRENISLVKNERYDVAQVMRDNINMVKNEQYDVAQAVRDNINLDIEESILEVPEILTDGSVTRVMSHLVVGTETTESSLPELNVSNFTDKIEAVIMCQKSKEKDESKLGYVTEYMSEKDMLATREEEKKKVQYASSVYKCELCIIGFYTQQQVEDHFLSAHRTRPGINPCKVCYVYIDESKMQSHLDSHYLRHICKLCGHTSTSAKLMGLHVKTHLSKSLPSAVIKIGDAGNTTRKGRKKRDKEIPTTPPKPGDLRKLLSKTTIEGYQCLECDMFFKNSRARKNHVARYHREGLQCDHCKKRFVNRTTLATHLRLHEGPLPREECPICHKLVRVIQLKYHIQRHENKSRYECTECNKVFSHLATYQAHLKYSRAHATDQVFKFPCPMCNKGYPTKEAMQDHFNYQHLSKTSHKCPICDKPIASRANVEKHMMRVHSEKKEKPRNHVCQQCGKAFTDKKALTQHEVIHSGERPLSCDVCQQTFKQKASLYTHRKRVHKIFPNKRVVEFMDSKPEST